MNVVFVIVSWLLFTITRAFHFENHDHDVFRCKILSQEVDIDKLIGRWYVVEIIRHRNDSNVPEGRSILNVCPKVELYKFSENGIHLHWWENKGDVNYYFLVKKYKSGEWDTHGSQNGTMMSKHNYVQFAGTVYVTKAILTHVILTFCTPDTKLYSYVLSKYNNLTRLDYEGIHNLLERRNLFPYSTLITCKDSASSIILSGFLIFISSIFLRFV